MTDRPADKTFNFSRAYAELEGIVKEFEAERVDLDEGLKKFERGLALAKQLKDKLKDVEQKIEQIKVKFEAGEDEPAPEA